MIHAYNELPEASTAGHRLMKFLAVAVIGSSSSALDGSWAFFLKPKSHTNGRSFSRADVEKAVQWLRFLQAFLAANYPMVGPRWHQAGLRSAFSSNLSAKGGPNRAEDP